MAARAVHWHEGMFLWPQQLQLAERHQLQRIGRQHKFNVAYNWGLRSLKWDEEGLKSSHFAVKSLEARMRDGSLIVVPDDGALAPLDLKNAFDRDSVVTLYLALPKVHLGKPNTIPREEAGRAEPGADRVEVRWLVETQDIEDENTGVDAQPVQVRFWNLKLLTSYDDLAGYELLPLARIKKDGGADSIPELDKWYIPPLLACDAWAPLHKGILEKVFDRFGRLVNLNSRQIVSRGISFDTHNPGDSRLLSQLQVINECYALLRALAFAEGVHPLDAYMELCRASGQLAIFTETCKLPDDVPPRYDHDDLGGCFYRIQQYLDSVKFDEPIWEERPFIGKNSRMEVKIEPKWMEPKWDMYVGVHSNLTQEEVVKLLTRAGQLDMKMGSADRVEFIFDRGLMGLEFTHTAKPPRALPVKSDLYFFQINRATKLDEWNNVQRSLTLAIRFNPTRVVGNIDGQTVLQIRTASEQKTIQFTLFLVPKDGNP